MLGAMNYFGTEWRTCDMTQNNLWCVHCEPENVSLGVRSSVKIVVSSLLCCLESISKGSELEGDWGRHKQPIQQIRIWQ